MNQVAARLHNSVVLTVKKTTYFSVLDEIGTTSSDINKKKMYFKLIVCVVCNYFFPDLAK